MTRARSVKHVLKEIGCPHLKLYRGEGYWYFAYDNPKANIFETESVYVMRLSDMALGQWVEVGKGFVAEVECVRHYYVPARGED